MTDRDIKLAPGITPAGKSSTPTVWNILGHTYYEKANSATAFSFETFDPPGTFVPPHIHPTQDEFIYMLEGTFDLYLDGQWVKAGRATSCACRWACRTAITTGPTKPTRALFWVSPSRRLKELFDQLHNLADPEEVVRRSAAHEVDFLPPGSVPGA